jgi:RepB DNA-primase from phage plasmid
LKIATHHLSGAERYLRMLSAFAPPSTLLEVRYRVKGRDLARFFMDAHDPRAASKITKLGGRTDVYVGCAPRVCKRGTREDIAPTALLWVDCDGPAAVAALLAFQPAASMIVTSGSTNQTTERDDVDRDELANAHGYWALTHPLSAEELHDANRRLAQQLGADPRCADPPRILRVPDTLNFKGDPPRPVRLRQYTSIRYQPAEILSNLPPSPTPQAAPPTQAAAGRHHSADPLLAIEPARYVHVLTGREPGREGKIHCPFHHPDNTPSFHVYRTPGRGWTCFGCTAPGGKLLGGDIYTLASLVWGIPASGRDFIELQSRLDALFAVNRAEKGSGPRATVRARERTHPDSPAHQARRAPRAL